MHTPIRAGLWPKENPAADFIPYTTQVDRFTIKTEAGDFLQIIRLDGIAHESADYEDVVVWRNQLNQLFKNISSPNTALWTHTVRREENAFPQGEFAPGFARILNDKYRGHLANTKMMINELYLTVVYRPQPNKAVSMLDKLANRNATNRVDQQTDALEKLHELVSNILAGLYLYSPRILRTYEYQGTLFSEPLEFLAFLVNGEWQRFPVPRSRLADVLPTSRPFFGHEAFEIRRVADSHVGAILAIKEYPESTEAGLLNALLSAPFPIVLAQSFTFLSRPVATQLLKRQQGRMVNSGDLAESQIQQIDDALDDLTAGRFVMGEHHLTLALFAPDMQTLKGNVAGSVGVLADSGMVVAREDLALEAAYWAQLPANFKRVFIVLCQRKSQVHILIHPAREVDGQLG
ncbi:hypothetical protein K6T12_21205 [Marinobacterium sp. CAU 1594]|nr:hypothetical protein [Marinobacterium arenosum]